MTADGGAAQPAGDDRDTGDLVHDLRTPLTIVLGFADLLRKRGDTLADDERTEFVERIDAAAKDMKRILDAQPAGVTGEQVTSGRYRHYKGGEYQVLCEARHSETDEPLVVYRALYGEHGVWVRPKAMFCESVTVDGERRPRFVRVP